MAWALIPRIWSARDKANDTAVESNVRSLATAMVNYGLENWPYPETLTDGMLTWYSIPNNNFDGSPAWASYNYRRLDVWKHFLIYAVLSAGTGAAWWGNCDSATASGTTTYSAASSWATTTWDAFCYFQ